MPNQKYLKFCPFNPLLLWCLPAEASAQAGNRLPACQHGQDARATQEG